MIRPLKKSLVYCNKPYSINSKIFARALFSRNFVKIKSSRNGEITLLFTDLRKSFPNREFLTSQICLLALFAKIKFSRKIPDLQYPVKGWQIFECLIARYYNHYVSPSVLYQLVKMFITLEPHGIF